jgi:hypothetical protein
VHPFLNPSLAPLFLVLAPTGSLDAFLEFLTREVGSGKDVLSGAYVLPNGAELPLSEMIAKLQRDKMIEEVEEVSASRTPYVGICLARACLRACMCVCMRDITFRDLFSGARVRVARVVQRAGTGARGRSG